jgi:hypothetical protein
MGRLLTTASTLQCPHGGAVSIASSNAHAKADGAFIARASDTFTVGGCPFTLVAPHPCAQVQWITSALRVRAAEDSALTEESVGLCLAADGAPQGAVLVVDAQTEAQGQ